MKTQPLPATALPWFRALHSYAVGWADCQPEPVRSYTADRFTTAEAFLAALRVGSVGLEFDTDTDAGTTDVYVLLADDAGVAHVLGRVAGVALGLPTSRHVSAGLAAAGWGINPAAAAPDDASSLLGDEPEPC
jgi:hypothetical protein